MTDNGRVSGSIDNSAWRQRVQQLSETTDGSTAVDGIGLTQTVDRVAAFGPAILAIRWAITITSLALATQRYLDAPVATAIWAGILLVYAIARTVRPIRYTGDVRSLVEVLAEVTIYLACIATTGFWDSLFILTLLTAVSLAGFARGFAFALRISIVSALAVSTSSPSTAWAGWPTPTRCCTASTGSPRPCPLHSISTTSSRPHSPAYGGSSMWIPR